MIPTERQRLFDWADRAYEAESQAWFNGQSTERLVILWGEACTPEGAAWDDEVYDALAARGYWKCRGCGSEEHALGGTLKCPDCVAVDVHNYRALHDGRMKIRDYNRQEATS